MELVDKLNVQEGIMSNGLFTVVLLGVFGLLAVVVRASEQPSINSEKTLPEFRAGAVRYQVKDVDRSVAFYTKHLGFKVERHFGPGAPFGSVSCGTLIIWLSGPESSGSRTLPDGRKQEPGGWNRIALEVDDLVASVEFLKKAGVRFRNEIVEGPGGKQIQLEDPDGNPVELFEPAS